MRVVISALRILQHIITYNSRNCNEKLHQILELPGHDGPDVRILASLWWNYLLPDAIMQEEQTISGSIYIKGVQNSGS